MKAEITGKSVTISTNKDTGEVREFNVLHYVELLPMKPSSKNEMCEGRKVGSVKTGLDIKGIKVGGKYNLDFEIKTFNDKQSIKLADFEAITGA